MSGNYSPSVSIPLRPTDRTDNYFRGIFNKYDRDGDGFLTIRELNEMIESKEYEKDIPLHCVKKIHEMHDKNRDRRLNFEEFIEMIHNPELNSIFGHYITRYINWIVPKPGRPTSHTVTDGEYEEQYSCYPPAVGMILISLVEIIFFCIDEATIKDSTKSGSGPTATLFIYEPYKRYEVWRYVTYMFVHIGVFHLFVNLAVQILLGLPLEMVHKWWRVLIVYFAGVLAGSLATSITDPNVKLAGASGGVYSLITAHVASIIMNWKEMAYPLLQLLVFIIVAASDVGTAIYYRYVLNKRESIGYVAHFGGALAGLLVGINILRNLSETKTEKIIWWVSITIYTFLMAMCIIWNISWTSYFPTDATWQNYLKYNQTRSHN
ncbi:rhomboid-related protein 2 [Anthonomus grandis grandis]|uniref:rhomboid-related protein 2 n=1 Tax=Anthonomus grandis grandis TaxID=2921223 RepID=UPI002166AED6|nr:rhomboid-related protein 2 [Anthonomus grandis grandis]